MFRRMLPLMDADGEATGVATVETTEEPTVTDGNADAEADINARAQKIADAMVAKKLKNMPSKEELAEFKAYKESQKTEAERVAESLKSAEDIKSKAEATMIRANAMICASKEGIKPDYIEDAIILAMAKVTDDVSIEDAIKEVASKNIGWKLDSNPQSKLPDKGSNPALGVNEDLTKIKRHF